MLKEHILHVLQQSGQPMFLHEIKAALTAHCGSASRPYKNDAELIAGIMELVSAGEVSTLGPAYLLNKK